MAIHKNTNMDVFDHDMKMSFGLSMVCLRFCVIFLLFVAETNFVFTKLNMHGGKVFGVV